MWALQCLLRSLDCKTRELNITSKPTSAMFIANFKLPPPRSGMSTHMNRVVKGVMPSLIEFRNGTLLYVSYYKVWYSIAEFSVTNSR